MEHLNEKATRELSEAKKEALSLEEALGENSIEMMENVYGVVIERLEKYKDRFKSNFEAVFYF